MTYMFILKCALKLVPKNILYYDARSEKHQNLVSVLFDKVLSTLRAYIYQQRPNGSSRHDVAHLAQTVSACASGPAVVNREKRAP